MLPTCYCYSLIIEKKTIVYHAVNGDHALFHTSKTAKMILRAPCQNVSVRVKQSMIAVNSAIN